MTPVDRDRWRRLQPILDEVLDLPPAERRRRIEGAGGDDPMLAADLEALLRADAETGVLDARSDALVESAFAELERDRSGEGRLLPGARIAGRYRVVSLLGHGGMGEVYRADDLKLGQAVALKFLPTALEGNARYRERLLTETKLARQIAHPNVCRVYDVGEWHGRQFLSMEYIDGEDLASLIRRIGHLPRQKALDIARQLCAGLDAAHQLGILHRDLKPANVMLDGNGRVRITDFGLAVAAPLVEGGEARAGTPGYMAPEQLEGREATPRSDVYALGLVLYELFTGRRAFQAATIEQLRRLQEDSSPTRPSALVEGFDPAIEHAILRCLEKDPAFRPASAREVAAALPGGDPLAVALAAGETPSPELVAASGSVGALRPAAAFAMLAGTLALLVLLFLLVDRTSTLGWVSWPRSPDALEDHARGILARLGYETPPVDRARMIVGGHDPFRRYVHSLDRSSARWNVLRQPGQFDTAFYYGQAQRYWMPLNWFGVPLPGDPAPAPGDVLLGTDLRGRLFSLLVYTPEAEPPRGSPPPDWSRLFEEAGLDLSRFEPTAPTRLPPVTADARAAWTGTLTDFGNYPVRIEAAALHGKPVFFEKVVPWDSYWDPATNSRSAPARVWWANLGTMLIVLFAFVSVGVLVVHNWLNGRGDRRGAFRVAAAVFGLRAAAWIFGAHHVPSPGEEWVLIVVAIGRATADAAFTWCVYVALEPHARRLSPRLLVSWMRVIRGRAFDPLVGRDILHGVGLAMLALLFWAQLYVVIPHALGHEAPPPPRHFPLGSMPYLFFLNAPLSRSLLGGRHVLETIIAAALAAFGSTLVFTMLTLGLRLLLRSAWAVVAVLLVVAVGLGWPTVESGFTATAITCSLVGGAVFLLALYSGLLSVVVMWFCISLWMNLPVTTRLDVPHFGTGLVAVALIALLAVFAAITASRGYKGGP